MLSANRSELHQLLLAGYHRSTQDTMTPAVTSQIPSITDPSPAPAMSRSTVTCEPAATPAAQLERSKHRQPCHRDDGDRGHHSFPTKRTAQSGSTQPQCRASLVYSTASNLLGVLMVVDRVTHSEACFRRQKAVFRWLPPPSSCQGCEMSSPWFNTMSAHMEQ